MYCSGGSRIWSVVCFLNITLLCVNTWYCFFREGCFLFGERGWLLKLPLFTLNTSLCFLIGHFGLSSYCCCSHFGILVHMLPLYPNISLSSEQSGAEQRMPGSTPFTVKNSHFFLPIGLHFSLRSCAA